VTVTVVGRPVTVVVRVDLIVVVTAPPPIVVVMGLPVTVTVLPCAETVRTMVEVT